MATPISRVRAVSFQSSKAEKSQDTASRVDPIEASGGVGLSPDKKADEKSQPDSQKPGVNPDAHGQARHGDEHKKKDVDVKVTIKSKDGKQADLKDSPAKTSTTEDSRIDYIA